MSHPPEKSAASPPHSRRLQTLADLNPAYFALVMATGIVSIASQRLQMPEIASVLFGINIVAFLFLVILFATRLVNFPGKFFADLVDHRRGVGFFTFVAATCVLGTQFLIIANQMQVAIGLWCVGIVFWFLLTYVIFTSFAVKEVKPTLAEGIHGGWLVSVVATQAVSLLGGLLSSEFGSQSEPILFFSLTMWLGGGMLYIWIISLIFYRYSFFPMSSTDLSPPYWINMGAMAISTLAGISLVSKAEESELLQQLLPFLKGLSLLFWATATWWIPMLVILGIWRHLYKRIPLAYDPQYWSLVFPLGMYTVCSHHLATELNLPYLFVVPKLFVYIALAAWTVTFAGLLRAIARPRQKNS